MTESLVAVRDRRDQVIARLSECYATDVLEVEELERRLDLAHAARTVAELDALVADLAPPPLASSPQTALVPVSQALAVDDPNRAARKKLRVLFANVQRSGRWSVPRSLRLGVWFGNAELDFREASLAPGVTTVHVGVTMGNLEVIVPPWLAIEGDLSSMFGNVEEIHRTSPEADPQRPLVRFTGNVVFGSFEISTRLPGESRRQARRREKAQRKQLRAGSKALPPGR